MDPLSGDIILNDINLKYFNIKWLRHKIGFVNQEPILLSGSIEDNIVFGLKIMIKNILKKFVN